MVWKKIVFALVVSLLLVCTILAVEVNDFKLDESFNNSAFISNYYSVYLSDNQDSGIAIYKNVNNDAYDELNDEVIGHLVHDDGRKYLVSNNDMKVTKNADNTSNFTDSDHAVHGVLEVAQKGREQYIVVIWAKDSSNITNEYLIPKLAAFNKDNNATAVAF